jgi:hypothetical protein
VADSPDPAGRSVVGPPRPRWVVALAHGYRPDVKADLKAKLEAPI